MRTELDGIIERLGGGRDRPEPALLAQWERSGKHPGHNVDVMEYAREYFLYRANKAPELNPSWGAVAPDIARVRAKIERLGPFPARAADGYDWNYDDMSDWDSAFNAYLQEIWSIIDGYFDGLRMISRG